MAKPKKAKRATIDKLGELHGILADELRQRIANGETIVTKDGDVTTISVSNATLNVARQFLRDNGIQADPATNDKLQGLVGDLPFDDDAEPANEVTH